MKPKDEIRVTGDAPPFMMDAMDDPAFLRAVTRRQEKKTKNLLEKDDELAKMHAEFETFNESYDAIKGLFEKKLDDAFGIELSDEEHTSIREAFMDKLGDGTLRLKDFVNSALKYKYTVQERNEHNEQYGRAISNLTQDKERSLIRRVGDAATRWMWRPLSPRTNNEELHSLGIKPGIFVTTKGYDSVIGELEAKRKEKVAGADAYEQALMGEVVEIVSKNEVFINKIKQTVKDKVAQMLGAATTSEQILEVREYYDTLAENFGEPWAKDIAKAVRAEQIDGMSIDKKIETELLNAVSTEMLQLAEGLEVGEQGAYSKFHEGLTKFVMTVGVEKWKDISDILDVAIGSIQPTTPPIVGAMKQTLLKAAKVDLARRIKWGTLGK